MKTYKALVTTVPFGEIDSKPIDLMNDISGIEYVINPIGRKLKEDELADMVVEYDILIAGTEPITRKVMKNGKNLKLISRVGIGLDSVDLSAAKELGIQVSYTPDAPAPAVAELTLGHMLNLMRSISYVDRKIRDGIWQRIHGQRLANMTIGIIGTGRIGSKVLRHLQGFRPAKIYVNDINPNMHLYDMANAELTDKKTIYKECDIISLHVPLTPATRNMITVEEMKHMKQSAVLINTSRGGIVNEDELYTALKEQQIQAAAMDVFETEPYEGNLTELDNCVITCHMGSMTKDCRAQMEIEATEEAIRFVKGEELQNTVPQTEYDNQI